jgi:hypothetical protein
MKKQWVWMISSVLAVPIAAGCKRDDRIETGETSGYGAQNNSPAMQPTTGTAGTGGATGSTGTSGSWGGSAVGGGPTTGFEGMNTSRGGQSGREYGLERGAQSIGGGAPEGSSGSGTSESGTGTGTGTGVGESEREREGR